MKDKLESKPYRGIINTATSHWKLYLTVIIALFSYSFYQLLNRPVFLPITCKLAYVNCPRNVPISGYASPELTLVKDEFVHQLTSGQSIGAGLTIIRNDEVLIDIYGGYSDQSLRKPYQEDTLQLIYSTSKLMESYIIGYLIQNHQYNFTLKYPINYKQLDQLKRLDITLDQIMRHETGTVFFDPMPTYEDLLNYEKSMGSILSNHIHQFDGKPTRAYNTFTRGWILDQLVRQTDPEGRGLQDFLHQVINKELDLEFYWGAQYYPQTKYHAANPKLVNRITKWYSYPLISLIFDIIKPNPNNPQTLLNGLASPGALLKESIGFPFTESNLKSKFISTQNNLDFIKLTIPSATGFTTCGNLGKLGQAYLKGNHLVNDATLKLLLSEGVEAYDHTLGINTKFTLGGLGQFDLPHLSSSPFYGWGGYGGSIMLIHPKSQLVFAYCPNSETFHLNYEGRVKKLIDELSKSITIS